MNSSIINVNPELTKVSIPGIPDLIRDQESRGKRLLNWIPDQVRHDTLVVKRIHGKPLKRLLNWIPEHPGLDPGPA